MGSILGTRLGESSYGRGVVLDSERLRTLREGCGTRLGESSYGEGMCTRLGEAVILFMNRLFNVAASVPDTEKPRLRRGVSPPRRTDLR